MHESGGQFILSELPTGAVAEGSLQPLAARSILSQRRGGAFPHGGLSDGLLDIRLGQQRRPGSLLGIGFHLNGEKPGRAFE